MQAVAELMEECLDLVMSEQRRPLRGRLTEVADQRRHRLGDGPIGPDLVLSQAPLRSVAVLVRPGMKIDIELTQHLARDLVPHLEQADVLMPDRPALGRGMLRHLAVLKPV